MKFNGTLKYVILFINFFFFFPKDLGKPSQYMFTFFILLLFYYLFYLKLKEYGYWAPEVSA